MSDQLVEIVIVLAEVGAELLQNGAVHGRMRSPFGLMQASFSAIAADAVEALCLVEVEVGGYYPWWQLQEFLHFLQL